MKFCIYSLDATSVTITTIPGNQSKTTDLIIIPGFSLSSYERNENTLFNWYGDKQQILTYFRQVHKVQFVNDKVRNLHLSLFNKETNEIKSPELENMIYRKCAELIIDRLNGHSDYTILGKSAGGGVAMYIASLIPHQIHKLLLFAPGVKFIHMDPEVKIKINPRKIVVGWNKDDTKIDNKMIWETLHTVLPYVDPIIYPKLDIPLDGNNKPLEEKGKPMDTQHEINTDFFENIK